MNWLTAPGTQTGHFAWAKDGNVAETPRAHCYRRGYGTKTALCAHTFASRIEFPHERDKMCETCRQRVVQIVEELKGLAH